MAHSGREARMLNPNEKRLVLLLGIVLAVCLVGAFVFFMLSGPNGLDSVNKEIKNTETQIRTMLVDRIDPKDLPQRIEEINTILEREKNKIYKANEIDISRFGIQVRKLMTENRLTEQSMKTMKNTTGTSLQFQFTGTAYDFSTFLKDVSINDKYWKIEDLYIKAGKGRATVDVTMRITYETANS
jgi:hypothetical protein